MSIFKQFLSQWFPAAKSVFMFPIKFFNSPVLELLAHQNTAVKIPSNLGQNTFLGVLFSKGPLHNHTQQRAMSVSLTGAVERQFGVTYEARGRSTCFG
jgi:hypothetical protein